MPYVARQILPGRSRAFWQNRFRFSKSQLTLFPAQTFRPPPHLFLPLPLAICLGRRGRWVCMLAPIGDAHGLRSRLCTRFAAVDDAEPIELVGLQHQVARFAQSHFAHTRLVLLGRRRAGRVRSIHPSLSTRRSGLDRLSATHIGLALFAARRSLLSWITPFDRVRTAKQLAPLGRLADPSTSMACLVLLAHDSPPVCGPAILGKRNESA